MLVHVAIGTVLELDLEERVFTLGNVATRALHRRMSALQGIGRGRVILCGECRGLEPVHGMAGGALATARTLGELSLVRVRLVTVHAFLKGQGLLEISARVALRTFHTGMLAQQGILGGGVIEALADRLRRHSLPSAGVVARLAALVETSAMRISVTIGAFAEGDSRVARLIVRTGRMTFLAGDLCVQSSQRIICPRMVKLPNADRFPIVVGMALQTVIAQPSLVLVLVTGDAGRGDTQECLIQILDFEDCALRPGDMFCRVTTIAVQP